MPKYVYNCEEHGVVEEWGKFSDTPLQPCPECAKPMKRIYRPPAIIMKI